ncbi:MAG TPA: LCP family protein, partial [Candidatus Magasanikbacteria bacterium]|nr:LCP family protein [Candidatus Magasanikbacteria bacterium]
MMEEQHINLLDTQADFEQPGPRKKSRWLFLLIAVIVLLLGGCSALAILSRTGNSVEYDPNTLEPKSPEGFFKKLSYLVFKKNINLEGEKMDRINILLLGMGGPGHDGPYLTDTIIIASIQPSTNQVALISIPRDLGVQIKERGVYRINSANAYGEADKPGWGGAYATEVISETFGVDIPYYIRLDFTAFKEIIDEVGGVRIEVAKTFTDYQYPGPNESYQTVSFKAGPQTMDGETALKYARSRHGNNGEGSDFARARRQQQILLALKEKVLSFATLANPLRIKKIMDALEKNMTTNMQFDEIVELVRMGRELDTATMQTLVLDDSPTGFLVNASTPGGAFILSPKKNSFDDISLAIENIFTLTSTPHSTNPPKQTAPEVVAIEPAIEIQNGTWSAGLAARVEAKLKEKQIYSESIG